MPDVFVTGADQLISLSKRLRATGDKELKKELRVALREATKPMKAAIKRHARETLPKRGGLNEVVARSRITTQVKGSGYTPGIRIASKSHDARLDSQGRLRHPTFGRRGPGDWREQHVTPGWFTVPATRTATQARVQILLAMKRIERKLEAR